jgi:hypothetical protein
MARTGIDWYAGCAAMAAMVMASVVAARAEQRASADNGERSVFSADVVIEEQVVDEHGTVVEARPQTAYRMTVRRGVRGLRTEIVYPQARLFPKGPLVDPRSGYRVEVGSDLSQGRIYDAAGAIVFGSADGAATTAAPDGPTSTGLVLADRDVKARKRDLERTFGQALERIDGRDRYLSSDGDLLTETLVEPATNLPVEVNVVRDGALTERTAISYGRMPGGRWYVARTRSERALPGEGGRRAVSTRTHTNVVSQEAR